MDRLSNYIFYHEPQELVGVFMVKKFFWVVFWEFFLENSNYVQVEEPIENLNPESNPNANHNWLLSRLVLDEMNSNKDEYEESDDEN